MSDQHKREGQRYYDPAAEMEFEVVDGPDTTGVSVAELDSEQVSIRYEDGQQLTVPHERFRGRSQYERLAEGSI